MPGPTDSVPVDALPERRAGLRIVRLGDDPIICTEMGI